MSLHRYINMVEIEKLKRIHFLKDLSEDTLDKISTVVQTNDFSEETILIRQDDPQRTIFMLLRGTVFLNCRVTSGKAVTLEEIKKGQTFGLSSLMADAPATYTAICAENSTILTMAADQALELFASDFSTGFEVMRRAVEVFKDRMKRHTALFMDALRTHPAVVRGGGQTDKS